MEFFNYLRSKHFSDQTLFLFGGQEEVLMSFFSGLTPAFLAVDPQWVFTKNAFFNLKELQEELKISGPGRTKAAAAQTVTSGLHALAREFSSQPLGTSAVETVSTSAVVAFLPGGNFLSQCGEFSRSCHTLALKVLLQATFILSCVRLAFGEEAEWTQLVSTSGWPQVDVFLKGEKTLRDLYSDPFNSGNPSKLWRLLTLPSTTVTSAAPLFTRRRSVASVKAVLETSETLYSSLKELFDDSDRAVTSAR